MGTVKRIVLASLLVLCCAASAEATNGFFGSRFGFNRGVVVQRQFVVRQPVVVQRQFVHQRQQFFVPQQRVFIQQQQFHGQQFRGNALFFGY